MLLPDAGLAGREGGRVVTASATVTIGESIPEQLRVDPVSFTMVAGGNDTATSLLGGAADLLTGTLFLALVASTSTGKGPSTSRPAPGV